MPSDLHVLHILDRCMCFGGLITQKCVVVIVVLTLSVCGLFELLKPHKLYLCRVVKWFREIMTPSFAIILSENNYSIFKLPRVLVQK